MVVLETVQVFIFPLKKRQSIILESFSLRNLQNLDAESDIQYYGFIPDDSNRMPCDVTTDMETSQANKHICTSCSNSL